MSKRGLFIIIDGPSASGKDSIIKQVLKDLNKLSIKTLSIEETKERNYDRKNILEAKKKGDQEVAKVIINERKKLYQAIIIPKLRSGALIIVNRGEPATLAYQTIKHELTMEEVWQMHRQQQIPLPDLIVLTNCSVEEAARREKLRKASSEEKNKNWMSDKFTSARKEIHANYEIVKDFLEKKGIVVIYLKTDAMDIGEESREIVNFIKNNINCLHE